MPSPPATCKAASRMWRLGPLRCHQARMQAGGGCWGGRSAHMVSSLVKELQINKEYP